MRTILTGNRILQPGGAVVSGSLIIKDGRIAALEPVRFGPGEVEGRHIDAGDRWVCPGLIDVHIHGAVGVDTMQAASPDGLEAMARFLAGRGVTAFLPTTMTAPAEDILRVLQALAGCTPKPGESEVLGVHVEGPYISPSRAGAQPPEWIRRPDPAEYAAWFETGAVRLMTVAPELPGALDLIRYGVQRGTQFALGHSEASPEQVRAAVEAGANQATHTFNAMPGLHHREPGILGAVLTDDRVFAQTIADGAHLHPIIVDLITRLKGTRGTLLVTDAMQAAGLPDGDYHLGSEPVFVRGGIARNARGALASSTLTLDQAVKNVVAFTGLSFERVAPMASETPARSLGLFPRKGALLPGSDADIVVFNEDLAVERVILRGEVLES